MTHIKTTMQPSMEGLWLENGKLEFLTGLDLPGPQSDEALIKVKKAGICATDIAMIKGYYPFTGILGHEFVGEVLSCHRRPELIGKRVVGEINIPCRTCIHCNNGREHHCQNRKVLGIKQHHGAFARFMTLPAENLYPMPDCISDESAIFAEPLAAALRILSQVSISSKTSVLVSGAGRLGQLIAQVMAPTDCKLLVSARYKGQADILKSQGIHVISPEALEETVPTSKKFDVVIEATGSPNGFASAIRWVRPQGVFVLKSTFKEEVTWNLSAAVVDEITLIGSRCGPFSPAIKWVKTGRSNPKMLIQKVYSLKDGLKAFIKAKEPGILKVLIDMELP